MSTTAELELASNPRRDLGEKILSLANVLFDSVKITPLESRTKVPKILKSNNFKVILHVAKKYAFLEVTSKLKALPIYDIGRRGTYRKLFTPKGSGLPAAFTLDNSRFMRFGELNFGNGHAISIGSDVSLCMWECKSSKSKREGLVTKSTEILYVVAFGDQIREDEAWKEFDTLIRATLSDWGISQ